MTPIHVEINLAVKRIQQLSPSSLNTPEEIALIQPQKEHFVQKVAEIEAFLEANPNIAARFNTVEDGCGIVSAKYLEKAKERLSRMK